MANQDVWNRLVENLRSDALESYRKTTEYEYIEKQREEIDLLFRDNLTSDEKELVEECIFELGVMADHESRVVYNQGIKDCVWLLRNLGVLS